MTINKDYEPVMNEILDVAEKHGILTLELPAVLSHLMVVTIHYHLKNFSTSHQNAAFEAVLRSMREDFAKIQKDYQGE